MAGLYDRIGMDDNVQVHYLTAGFKGYMAGLWTAAQVLNNINSLLVTPLSGQEVTDLNDMVTVIDAKANNTQKLIYAMTVEAVMVAAEAGVLNEAGWRSGLEI